MTQIQQNQKYCAMSHIFGKFSYKPIMLLHEDIITTSFSTKEKWEVVVAGAWNQGVMGDEKLAHVAKKKDMSRHVSVYVGVIKFLNVATYDFTN